MLPDAIVGYWVLANKITDVLCIAQYTSQYGVRYSLVTKLDKKCSCR